MKTKLLTLFFTCLLFNQTLSAQCTETNEPRVLLIGDSWAFFMSVDQTINNALSRWGHSNYKFVSNSTVAENGAETDDFLKPDKQAEIINLLSQNPTIDHIHLSIGGNDVLGDWKVSYSQAQTDSLAKNVSNRLLAVISFLKSAKPGIKILWSGYVYPNFEEVITTSGLGSNHPFYGTWQKMEFPTFAQLNAILNMFSDSVAAYAATDPQVEFINATGLLQYTFGQSSPLGVAPGGSYPAFSVPLPTGDPNYPSPKNSMRDYLLTKDCFHLSSKGYLDFIEYHTQKYYHKELMSDKWFTSENNVNTGSVSSLGNVSAQLELGNQSGEDFAAVLSFNTSGMADTTLKAASIFMRRESLTGTNPVGSLLNVKIRNGFFGGSAVLEATDFSDAGDAVAAACRFGSNTGNGQWIRIQLPEALLPFITAGGTVQFMVSAPGTANAKMKFYDSANPEFAPVLNLTYGTPVSGLENISETDDIKVYPNPVSDQLYIERSNGDISGGFISDVSGRLLMRWTGDVKSVRVRELPPGAYLLQLQTANGQRVQRFIRE